METRRKKIFIGKWLFWGAGCAADESDPLNGWAAPAIALSVSCFCRSFVGPVVRRTPHWNDRGLFLVQLTQFHKNRRRLIAASARLLVKAEGLQCTCYGEK
jgi:hypothetical protein